MAKQIRGTDIIEKDHLSNAIKSADELLKTYKALDEQVIKTAKDIKKVSAKGTGNSAKEIKQLTTALSESEIAKRATLKIDKERTNLEIKLKSLNSEKIKQNDILKRQVQDQVKTNKAWAEGQKKLVGTEEKLLAANKKLRLERKKLDTTTKTGTKRLKEINKQLDRNNKILEKNSDKLKKQRLGIGRYGKAVQGLRSGLAQLGLAFGVFTLIKDSFNVIKNFDQAQADLSSVLGVTRDQMSALTEQAKELGATTKFTASQVSELQIEYAKLGFTQQEIQNVTEATLQLAAAAGTDLANAATITGSTLRAFGLDSTETQRVVDVMAKSFSSSSLDIEKFKVAMAAAAPVAKQFGFSVEETTALIGTLTDQGIDASAAGTGLRNMFLDSNKAGLTFQEALDKINNSTDKAGTSFDLFGKRGATLGVILAENQTVTAGLTETLNGAGGAAKEMADKQLDTLGGAIDLLRSAWEGIILKFSEGTGITDILKNAIQFLAENLETIVDVVIGAVKTFVTFKATLKAVTLASKAFGKSLSPTGLNVYAIALTAIVGIVLALMDAFKETADASNLMARMQDEVTEKLDKEKLALEQVREQLKLTTAGSEERQKILDETNRKYGTTLKNLEDEGEFVKQLADAYEDLIVKLEQRLEAEVREEFLKDLIEERFNIKNAIREIRELGLDPLLEKGAIEDALTQLDDVNDQIALLKDEIKEGGGLQIESADEIVEEEVKVVKSGSKKKIDLKKKELDELRALQELQTLALKNNLIERRVDEETAFQEIRDQRIRFLQDELALIERLYGKSTVEYQKVLLEFNTLTSEQFGKTTKGIVEDVEGMVDEVAKALGGLGEGVSKDAEKAEQERLKQLKKFRDDSLAIVKEITDGITQNIDKRISERQREIDESKSEVERLQVLAQQGNVDAAEAIKAEKIAQSKEKLEIERLEKRKRNLLISVAFLEKASQNIGKGDQNPFANASSSLSNFLSNLPKASEGTDYNVAQTFGTAQKTGTDGHLGWVDKEEKILSIKNSRKLKGMHQDEVTRRALAFDNNAVSAKAISISEYKQMTDENIVNKLDNVEQAIKNIKIVQQHIDLKTGEEVIRDGNKITRNNHRPDTFRI